MALPPVGEQREADIEVRGEGHLGEGSGHRDGGDPPPEFLDVRFDLTQLDQLAASGMAEVEYIERQQQRSLGDQLVEGHRLLEGLPQREARRLVSNLHGVGKLVGREREL